MISFTDLFSKLTNSKTWINLFTDPLKMALLMTATILLIIYLMFRNDIDEESGEFLNIMIKTSIYVAVANLAFLFIFHGSVSGKIEERHKSANDAAVVQHTTASMPSVTSVTPITPIAPITQATPAAPTQ